MVYSPITDFCLWYGLVVYRIEKWKVEIEIVSITLWLVWTGQNVWHQNSIGFWSCDFQFAQSPAIINLDLVGFLCNLVVQYIFQSSLFISLISRLNLFFKNDVLSDKISSTSLIFNFPSCILILYVSIIQT